jgi:hypothetical protein
MEAVLLSKSNYEAVKEALEEIKENVNKLTSSSEHFIDNLAFIRLMNISSRTAQIWRDEGKIGFSQQGKKIYYRMSDIDQFLEAHHRKPFAKGYESL